LSAGKAGAGGAATAGALGSGGRTAAGRGSIGAGGMSGAAGPNGGGAGGPFSASGGMPEQAGGRGGLDDGGTSSVGGSPSPGGEGGALAGGRSNGGIGGLAGSAGAPPVELPDGVTGLFPQPGAKAVCPDPSLRLSFSGPPSLGNAGSVKVYDAASPAQPIASVEFAAANVTDTIGGQTFNLERQVYVDGNDVVVYLKSRALTYGKKYYVMVDSGAIKGPANAAFAVSSASAWTFETLPAAPTSTTALDVALDGSGDFCSLQGALDALPGNNTANTTINVGIGTYHGVVFFTNKRNVHIHGADRKKVVLSGTNNDNLNPGTKARALIGADGANGLVIDNLTIHNLTPQGGSQAEALRLQGCDQCVVRDADILSLQDTLLWSGRIYAKDCYVAGNVDFVWGEGVVYFDSCEIKTVGRSGYVVQSRNATNKYGYVFVDSKISSDAGITGSVLARIDASVYPGSHVAYVDCTLGSHITSAGWTITGGSPSSSLRFWEYRSKNESGALVSTSGRATGSTQMSDAQAATMRDKSAVLGGWTPPE
jgi:pectin methylesterase-like acyl-CoA thioesterase